MSEQMQRRASLLAELFLRELNPPFLAQASYQGNRWDYIATFKTRSNANIVITVDVVATDAPVTNEFTFYAQPHWVRALDNEGDKLLILVVNVMTDEVYWGWANAAKIVRDPTMKGAAFVRLPVVKSSESTREKLVTGITTRN